MAARIGIALDIEETTDALMLASLREGRTVDRAALRRWVAAAIREVEWNYYALLLQGDRP